MVALRLILISVDVYGPKLDSGKLWSIENA